MTRDAFHQELQTVEDALVRMATRVEEALDRAVQALLQRDTVLAGQVIADDALINQDERAIRTHAVDLMARQAPVARDLRVLVTIQLVSNELERMGDHAVTVAKNAIRLAGLPPMLAVVPLPDMATLVQRQIRDAIQAFVEVNVVAARQICLRADAVDALYHALFEELLWSLRQADNVTQATCLLFVARGLERIGDRVTNICEDTIFLVTGEIEELN